MESKYCSKCNTLKSISDFCLDSSKKDGHYTICRYCQSERERIRRKNRNVILKHLEYQKELRKDPIRGELVRNYHTAYNKLWMKTSKGKSLEARKDHKRRMKELESPSTLTSDQWNKIIQYQNNRCCNCNRKFSRMLKPTRDHIIPLSLGGGLTFENTQALCMRCNVKKRDKIDREKIVSWGNSSVKVA